MCAVGSVEVVTPVLNNLVHACMAQDPAMQKELKRLQRLRDRRALHLTDERAELAELRADVKALHEKMDKVLSKFSLNTE
jgi:hypothetical protein